jgi:hypothetical protein
MLAAVQLVVNAKQNLVKGLELVFAVSPDFVDEAIVIELQGLIDTIEPIIDEQRKRLAAKA